MPHHKRPGDRHRRDRQGETRVSVNSMYGYKNKLPMVMLTVGDAKPLQFSTDEARRIARLLMEGAEAAEQDGFLLEFMMGPPIDLDEKQAANLLMQFREHRAKWMDDDLLPWWPAWHSREEGMMFDPSAPVEEYRRPAHVPAEWAQCAACGDLVPQEMARCCVTVDWGRHYEEMLCAACYAREVDDG